MSKSVKMKKITKNEAKSLLGRNDGNVLESFQLIKPYNKKYVRCIEWLQRYDDM